jgi:hypothetical protein
MKSNPSQFPDNDKPDDDEEKLGKPLVSPALARAFEATRGWGEEEYIPWVQRWHEKFGKGSGAKG